ncbi:MAG: HAD family phosphatase [Sporolactobacillus sp.]|jgi:HAD superfamily hydrolase (TIGR01509 family)|nr:HAD family phosphatase [Sporolactobacillus sp.]
MKFAAVVFDMDGVIINSEPFYRRRREVFFQNKKKYCYEQVKHRLTGSNPADMFQMIIPDDPYERQKYIKWYQQFKDHYPIDFAACKDAEIQPLLAILKQNQIKIALASSSNMRIINDVLTVCRLNHYFNTVVSGECCRKNKPDPEIYLRVAAELKEDPHRCVAVEDSEYGIEAGKKAGMTVIAKKIADPFVNQCKADYIVDGLLHVACILKLKETG